MSYRKRLDRSFKNAPLLPLNAKTKYVFFSDCHRGIGGNNDNFIKNVTEYQAALQYYDQYGFTYVEVGDGDELWENYNLSQIMEVHSDIFSKLRKLHMDKRLYMLYGNHDMEKKNIPPIFPDSCFYESLILESTNSHFNFYVTHGHQADFMNSVLWKFTRFLVRHLWTELENFGILEPTSASKNQKKKKKLEQKLLKYAMEKECHLLTGHSHHSLLGSSILPYHNCGSCVFPNYITCIELCGYHISLIKWYRSTQKSANFGNLYYECPPSFPIYIKREILDSKTLF